MYEVRDVGSFLIMLIVAPLFIAVFVIACIVLAPLFLLDLIWSLVKRARQGR